MDEDKNHEPGERMRNILSNPGGETDARPHSNDHPHQQSQLSEPHEPKRPARTDSNDPPTLSSPPYNEERGGVPSSKGFKFGPAFWTVTGILSLVVNAILIAVLLVLYNTIDQLQGLQGTASNLGSSVLGGMYSNFEKMDRATIKTVIPVDAQIPLDISVPVQTTTQITLAETVNIPNAQVVINTGGLNINSNARVTLPAGTPLMVNLNFDLPVQTTIPVHLDVPVNIPMAETELHEPFVGLQEVVRPWYCLVEPNAFSLHGQTICR